MWFHRFELFRKRDTRAIPNLRLGKLGNPDQVPQAGPAAFVSPRRQVD
jgi:hypothetical protein